MAPLLELNNRNKGKVSLGNLACMTTEFMHLHIRILHIAIKCCNVSVCIFVHARTTYVCAYACMHTCRARAWNLPVYCLPQCTHSWADRCNRHVCRFAASYMIYCCVPICIYNMCITSTQTLCVCIYTIHSYTKSVTKWARVL